jgi:two-component system cell cycle sensor histidine kinase/response regulator CckA
VTEALWTFFAEGVPDILLQLSDDGTILYINRAPGTLTREEMWGTKIYDYLPPAARRIVRLTLAAVIVGQEARVIELPIAFRDGGVHWYTANVGPVLFGDRVVAVTVVARDTTAQKQTELALRESEARYRTLVEHAPEAIVVMDVDEGRFVSANANACLLLELTIEQLLTRSFATVSPARQPDGRDSAVASREYIAQALEGEAPSFEWTHVDATDREVLCEVRLVRLPGRNRRLVRASIIDISGQRRLEHQVQQFQRLETLGHVAGGIVHDFNNLLTIIGTAAELLLAKMPDGAPGWDDALAIRAAVARGSLLTRQFLGFTKSHDPVREPMDLNDAVEHVVLLLGRFLGYTVHVEQRLNPGKAEVIADRGQVDQILTNLLLNARDAMPHGGTIVVETDFVPEECAFALRVSDTGTGMDEATVARIFEPFFTTKPAGRGTGLGLSTVSMIVRQSGGRISVTSEPGKGSTFEVTFPMSVGGEAA